MCKLCKLISGLIILLAGISSARDLTVYGTIIDTVLETGSAIDPVLKIKPASACPVYINARCQEEESTLSKYFATTGSDGKFSIKMNLPETCMYNRFYITAACTTSSNTVLYKYYSIPSDSMFEKVLINVVRQNTYVTKTIKDSSYSHSVSFIVSPQFKGGDTMKLNIRTMANVDNPDTLKYPDCKSMVQLTTSTGKILFERSVGCNNSLFTLLTQKNSYLEQQLDIVIPTDLWLTHPEFKNDRTLKLTFQNGSKIESYSFTVLDSDIKVVDVTGVQKAHKGKTNDCSANLSKNSHELFLDISRSGIYSLELFAPNGRLLQSIAQNQHFESGKHSLVINKSNVHSSQVIIARLIEDGVKASTFLLK